VSCVLPDELVDLDGAAAVRVTARQALSRRFKLTHYPLSELVDLKLAALVGIGEAWAQAEGGGRWRDGPVDGSFSDGMIRRLRRRLD